MNKYKAVGTFNFLLGVVGISLPLFLYAFSVQSQTNPTFYDALFNQTNLTLLKVLIFNFLLGVINFTLGLLSFAQPPQSSKKYFADNIVIGITTFMFLMIIIGYSVMLFQNIVH